MTDHSEARFLIAFGRWANAQLLAETGRLTEEELTRDLKSSFPSVRDTLVHAFWAEWLWLERCRGRSPRDQFNPADFPTVDTLRSRWIPVEVGLAALVSDPGADLNRPVTYTNRQGEVWTYLVGQIIRHVVNHATYHRGQVGTLLRQLGKVPPSTDLLVFVDMGAPGFKPDA